MGFVNYMLRAESLFQRWWNIIKILALGTRGTILVFHEIDKENYSNTEESCFCSTGKFHNKLVELLEKAKFASIDDLLSSAGNNYVVTFDDVPESVYHNAYPILKEYNIPFVLYLSPKYIGKTGFLNEDQIRELDKDPLCTIGAHTMNHTKLRLENDSYRDMYDSKIAIEKIVGHPVEHLAYPYGRADSISCKVRKEAKRAGFKTAVCTIPTHVPVLFDKWYIPRIAFW